MPYYDLSVRAKSSSRDRDRQYLVKRALELGWDCIVWNTTLGGKLSAASAAQQCRPVAPVELDAMQRRDVFLHRSLVKADLNLSPDAEAATLHLRQLTRLSATFDDLADAQALSIGNEIVRQFDIIAASPGNAKVFSHLCKTADIDIISLDLTRRLPFQLNKKLIDEAIARGICFELCYSVILGSSACRKEMLSSSRTLVQYLRGRNLIFSSNADSVGQLRGPADVMNIAFSLGITAEFSVHTITRNSAQVVRHAACRKLRYLPAEIIAGTDFQTRWPELMLPDLQLLLQPQSSSKKRQRDQELDEEEQEHEDVAEEESEPNQPNEVAVPGGIEQGDGNDFLSF